MARYICKKKDSKITINKANSTCLMKRCPYIWIIKPILSKGKLKNITFSVINEELVDKLAVC